MGSFNYLEPIDYVHFSLHGSKLLAACHDDPNNIESDNESENKPSTPKWAVQRECIDAESPRVEVFKQLEDQEEDDIAVSQSKVSSDEEDDQEVYDDLVIDGQAMVGE